MGLCSAFAGGIDARAGVHATLSTVEPTGGAGRLAAQFDLVGMHWRGVGVVRFRTRSTAEGWSRWNEAHAEGTANGWRLGEPVWAGASDLIEWRTSGSVGRVRVHLVSSPSVAVPPRTVDVASSPQIVMRSAWQADEELRVRGPRYAPKVGFAIVHHTAGTNVYSPADSAAIVRAITVYHVKGNGWNDIGYNFLVDQYGQVFEGRHGGVIRNVVGAHAAGFNTGSVGIAVMGSHGRRSISPAARAALAQLIAWRLDVAHVDPSGTLTWASGGSSKYPTGTPVALAAVSGHRDVGLTECPGGALAAVLRSIASNAREIGLPKLFDVAVRGRPGGLVTFSARLSTPRPWKVSIRDATGTVVAAGSGTAAIVRWTWDARSLRGKSYSWRMETPGARAAGGTFGPSAPPRALPSVLGEFTVSPPVVSPDGDGYGDRATVSYRLRRPASVTARILGDGSATRVTLFQDQRQSARLHSWNWNADVVPDGRYTLEVTARGDDGSVVRASGPVLVSRTLGFLSAQPPVFSPNGDGNVDTITFAFDLGVPATVAVRVVQLEQEVVLVHSGALNPGRHQFVWNGQSAGGTVPDGQYALVVSAADALGVSEQSVAFTVDS